MQLKTIATLTAVLLAGGVAQADSPLTDPCAGQPRKHTPRKLPKKPTKPSEVKPQTPCDCVGKQGPPGPKGPPGPRGDSDTFYVRINEIHENRAGIDLAVGVMGSVYAPHGDWAWGPALQLRSSLNKRTELVVDVGLALPVDGDFSPGHETGVLAHVGLARYFGKHLGLTAGIHYTGIDGSSSNGAISGDYLALVGGIVLRQKWDNFNLRVELSPALGGLRDTNEEGTQFSLGLTSSAFIGANW